MSPARTAPWLRVAPAVFLLAWGGNHFTPLLHLYEELGHYSPWQANLLLGLYVVGLIPGLLVAAALSDRHGRRPVLLAGLAAGAVGSILLGAGLHSMVLLCAGRALAGIGVGVAMSVGASWIKELSAPPHDRLAAEGAGSRRPSLTLTLGFALGAAVTGSLAQWGPAPAVVPYVVHLVLVAAAVLPVLSAPETVGHRARPSGPWWQDLRVPSIGHRRFTRIVLPAAPWVFAAAGVAYAIMPAVVAPGLDGWATLYATVLTVLTLGCGAAVQRFVAWLDRRTRGRALSLGMVLMVLGMVLAVAAGLLRSPAFALAVAVALGVAYGITVVAGLAHVQAIATPQDLAGLTGVFYALAYSGFLLPTLLAALLPVSPYPASLAVVALVCVVCLAAVSAGLWRLRRQSAAATPRAPGPRSSGPRRAGSPPGARRRRAPGR
ncbi:MFS transporter [Citricoccus sp. I39-566]|uniref:MFS transporter n=1 Tax=Citricoccus sp. I39-566 TaxID=3073268 RepID=UPI00286B8F14|nr:MFS transporter [Citricoccus sp. I39-566]WMY78389.1 MFS transporter [Citricoccus sp. I39-566]